jgi:hypothetical protein
MSYQSKAAAITFALLVSFCLADTSVAQRSNLSAAHEALIIKCRKEIRPRARGIMIGADRWIAANIRQCVRNGGRWGLRTFGEPLPG